MGEPAEIVYRVERPVGWELPEATMPESILHDAAVSLLKALLEWWAQGKGLVARNLAIRWDESQPAVGVDPDVCVFVPSLPNAQELSSVRTWVKGQRAPELAIEVVSETNPRKDYVVAPDKYAASETKELWIFDPLLSGPKSHGGPFPLQVWERDENRRLVRTYAGAGPAKSRCLDAWLIVMDEGRLLRIAADKDGRHPWLTREEHERAAKEAERAAKEAALAAKEAALAAKEEERAAKEAALARVAELEAALRRK